jgi:hypothetical protein
MPSFPAGARRRSFPQQTTSMKQYVFADRVVGVSVQNGLVRVDLATIAGPTKTKEGKDGLKMDVTHQVLLPLDAFMAGFTMQQKLVQELVNRQQKKAKGKAADKAETPASA